LTQNLTTTDHTRLANLGITPLTTHQATTTLTHTLTHHTHPHLLITNHTPPTTQRRTATNTPTNTTHTLIHQLTRMTTTEQHQTLLELVQTHAAVVLGHRNSHAIDIDRAFKELGFDSLTSVELRNRLNAATGLKLTPTAIFDHPNPQALAHHIHTQIAPESPAVPSSTVFGNGKPAAALDEPVAIVGMGCRFPGGVASPEELWELIRAGGDAIGAFPANRGWPNADLYDPDPDRPGTCYTRAGGFLYDADHFDAEFFGISPREAMAIDPQQRLLLETGWEAIERAGIDPATLRGSSTGVFTGVIYNDYASRLQPVPEGYEGHLLTGNSASVASGRIAYTLGLEGPAVTIDTACSSSLVAVHLAAQALRNGECELALAGGVTVMSTPTVFVEFSRQRGLAPDGRCKSFAAAADGTGWSEGAGIIVLERLSDAQRHNHPILAVIAGSAVNQDGASNGLTAPNGPSQERVIRQALANAHLTPDQVDAVEAHGTGTTLGDPIEAQALLATYGQHRPADRPLLLGSIKSNIGHTQAAAGIAGLIKMTAAMRHGQLPAGLHIDEPTPHADWDSGNIELLTRPTPWPHDEPTRRTAISSFGISGTNAHLILQSPPDAPAGVQAPPERAADGEGGPEAVPWVISAKSGSALRDRARQLRELLIADPAVAPDTIARALSDTRTTTFAERAVLVGRDRDDFSAGLAALAAGVSAANLVTGTPARSPGSNGSGRTGASGQGRTAFVFTGQGSQHPRMGRELYDRYSVFATAFDRICDEFAAHLDEPLPEIVFAASGTPEAALLDQTMYTQAAIFAVEVALFELVTRCGLLPDYLIGHSVGELAAAHAAGVLTLPDACTLVAARGRLMQAAPANGAMIAINASEEQVQAAITSHADTGSREAPHDQVAIAAINGPAATVISGDHDAVHQVADRLRNQGHRTRVLNVSHAFHSPHMDHAANELTHLTRQLTCNQPTIPLISNLTGTLASAGEHASPDYWSRHLRQAVRFHHGITALHHHGVTTYLELGPDAALTPMITETLAAEDPTADPTVLATLQRDRPEAAGLITALATAYTHGAAIDWTGLIAPAGAADSGRAPHVPLPTYPFQRQRYWLDASGGHAEVAEGGGGLWEAMATGDAEEVAAVLELDEADRSSLNALWPKFAAWHRQGGLWYEFQWKPVATDTDAALTGKWLVVSPTEVACDITTAATDALTERGAHVVRAALETSDVDGMFAGRIAAALADGPATGVLALLPSAEDRSTGAGPDVLAGLLVRALDDAALDAPLWILTRGAVLTGAADPRFDESQAAAWSSADRHVLENSRRCGGLIDLPDVIDGRARRRLADMLARPESESRIAIRGSGTFALRLARAAKPRPAWRPSGTALISGAGSEAGAQAARWLASQGAAHLILVGLPDGDGLVGELGDLGVQVRSTAVDLTDRAALTELLNGIPEEHPFTALVHAAPMPGDEPEAAIAAATALDELTRAFDLTAFVLFSPVAGALDSPVRAAMDAVARRRQASGLPATSVAWATANADGGLRPIHLNTSVVGAALTRREVSITVADIDWPHFAKNQPALAREIREAQPFINAVEVDQHGTVTQPEQLRQRLAGLSRREQEAILLNLVLTHAAEVLGHQSPEQKMDADTEFVDVGFSSLSALELYRRMRTITGLPLPPTVVYDYPKPAALAPYLRTEILADDIG
ncbi:hypothetical protein DPM19_24530, partial [Actinomadura craniellae]